MIIDIVSPFSEKIDYCPWGKTEESLIVFSPDKNKLECLKELYSKEGFSKKVEALIWNDETEISVIQVVTGLQQVRAFRSITSHYELFYYVTPEQDLILTDHVRNLLSYLPMAERTVDVDGVCDTFLYQHNYGTHTTVKGVWRLGAGELLEWTNQKLTVTLKQKLVLGKYDLQKEDGVQVLEETLREVIQIMEKPDSVNTLSGGVDSSLTQIYMQNRKSVSACYGYEKFQCEREYAEEAARLLHTDHTVYMISMEEYFRKLEEVIKTFGLSAYNMTAQVMHYTLGKQVEASHMFLSEIAGAVYGLGMRQPLTEERRLKYPIEHRYNYANIYGEIARLDDVRLIDRIFGEDIVDRSLERRNRYVLERLEHFDTADQSYDNLIQLGHLSYYLTNNAISTDEQIEMAFGKTLNTPYSGRRLVESFLSLKLAERYENVEYGEKPYAKRLLQERLPGYEVNKSKLGGSLPRTWMVTEGPLGGYFKQHELPDFVQSDMREELRNPSWDNSWGVKYTVMHQLWYENVLQQNVTGHHSKWLIKG